MLNFVKYNPTETKGKQCCICGTIPNTKYEIAIHEDSTIKFLPCCSICCLQYIRILQDNMHVFISDEVHLQQ